MLQPFLTRLLGDPQTAALVSIVVADSLPAVYLWMLETEHAPPVREAREAERTSEVLRELGRILSAEHWDPFALEGLFEEFPATRVFVERVLRHVEADTQEGKARHYARLIQGELHTPSNEEQVRLEREAMSDALARANPTDIHLLGVLKKVQENQAYHEGEGIDLQQGIQTFKLPEVLSLLKSMLTDDTTGSEIQEATPGYIEGRLFNLLNLGLLSVVYRSTHTRDSEGSVLIGEEAEAYFSLTPFGMGFVAFLHAEGSPASA